MGSLGDTMKLRALVDGMRGLANRSWRPRLMKVLAQEAVALSQECFAESKDPYGNAWPPLKIRQGQPLLDTGRLRNSISGRANGSTSFVVGTNVKYARLQNFGGTVTPKQAKSLAFKVGNRMVFTKSVKVPARPFFPKQVLPKLWADAFFETASGFLASLRKEGAR
jgi:phage gpG-like protein